MRILIFGAGASIPARYPSAEALIPTVGQFVEKSHDNLLKKYWERWDSWRRSHESLKILMFNPNPEVVLSLVDLCEAAYTNSDHAQIRAALEKCKTGQFTEQDELEYQRWWKSPERKSLEEATLARDGFIECLTRFLYWRHYKDASHRVGRDYLRRHFAKLSEGDIVITFNWDTTTERTLAEEGYWNPITGYGFHHGLATMPWGDPLPNDLPLDSKIHVLKLHGSLGWHRSLRQDIYFDNPRFLHNLAFHTGGRPLPMMDPVAPNGQPSDPVLLYPSYLKQLSGETMQRTWYRASRALERADRIDVYGYSLPESDLAIRTLLNPLRFRVKDCDGLRLRVHDPSPVAQDRWKEFLGSEENIDGRRIEEEPV